MQVFEIRTRGRSALNASAPSENVSRLTLQGVNQHNESIHTNASAWGNAFINFTAKWSSRLTQAASDSVKFASDKLGLTRLLGEVEKEMMLEDLVIFKPYGLADVSINTIDKMPRALCASLAHRAEIFIRKHFEATKEIVNSLPNKTKRLTNANIDTERTIAQLKNNLAANLCEEDAVNLQRRMHKLYCRSLDAYSIGVSWVMLLTDKEFIFLEESKKDESLALYANTVIALRENLIELEKTKAIYEAKYELESIELSEDYQRISEMLKNDFEDDESLTLEEFPGNTIPLSLINHLLEIQAYACQRAELLGENWVLSPQTRLEAFLREHRMAIQSLFRLSLIATMNSQLKINATSATKWS